MSYKHTLLTMTALTAVAGYGAVALHNPAAIPLPAPVSAAKAQTNPCAPASPCAPARRRMPASPCAAAPPAPAASPCAPGPAPAAESPCAARPAVAGAAANPYDVAAGHRQAPYGDEMPAIVRNYLRAAPYVGTGGVVATDSFAKLKELGFRTIINLNTEAEGAPAEGRAAAEAGLSYVSIPVAATAPTAEQVAEFSKYVNDPARYPILVHCQSSNRVGAMWALYRAHNAVPPEIAIQEGRTVGLESSREGAVRAMLNLPPMAP